MNVPYVRGNVVLARNPIFPSPVAVVDRAIKKLAVFVLVFAMTANIFVDFAAVVVSAEPFSVRIIVSECNGPCY